MSLLDNYTEDELFQKLERADAAGDTAAASQFAEMVREKRQLNTYREAGKGVFGDIRPEEAQVLSMAGNSNITENVMAGMQAGVGGMLENASRGMNWLSNQIYGEPEGAIEQDPSLGQRLIDSAQDRRRGEGFMNEAAYEFGRVLPGYGASMPIRAAQGSGFLGQVAQEAARGGVSEAITQPQESLETAVDDAMVGAAGGAFGEVLGAAAAPVIKGLVNKGLEPGNSEIRTSLTNQYKQMKADIENPDTKTTASSVWNHKLKDTKGFDTNITYGDMVEAESKLNFVEELNNAGYKGGIETVKKVMRDSDKLKEMGIIPSKKESLYGWVNNKLGSDVLDQFGIRTRDLEGIRADAFKTVTEDRMKRISSVVSEDPAMAPFLEPLVKSAEAFQKGDIELSRTLTANFEDKFGSLVNSLDRANIPKETNDFINDMFALNRDLKSISKIVKGGKRTSNELRSLTSVASLVGIGFLTHPLAALAAPFVRAGTSKAFSNSVGNSLSDAANAFRGNLIDANLGRTFAGRMPYEQPWEQGLVQHGVPTVREGFHGSTNPYVSYDPNKANPIYGREATGVQFSSPNRADAEFYAGQGGSVNRYVHEMKNPATFNAGGQPLPMGKQRALIDQARRAGHDYVVIRNLSVGGGSTAPSPEIYVKIGNTPEQDVVQMSMSGLNSLLGVTAASQANGR